MRKVVKPKNLLGFRIWLEKLGYCVKDMQDHRGFNFRTQGAYGMVTKQLGGNPLAFQLGREFEKYVEEISA